MRENLAAMFAQADAIDHAEGQLAYRRYNRVMREMADAYDTPLDRVVAAFVSLSPNSDYVGNLRSTLSVLEGVRHRVPLDRITVSTYGHCKRRAYEYVTGQASFLERTRGLKILSFYHNVLDPEDHRYVTIDGHVCAAWRGQNLVMKDALVGSARNYREIEHALKELAFRECLLPNQYQAILWFARKRVLRIKYEAQLRLGQGADDQWRTYIPLTDLRPYRQQSAVSGEREGDA